MPIRRWLKLARSDRSGRLGSACSMPVLCVLYMLYISAARSCGSLACRFAGGNILRILTSVIALVVNSSCTLSHVTYALLLLFCLHAYSQVAEARPLRPERAPWKCLFDARSILCVLYMLYVDSPVGAGALEVPAPMPAPCMIN